MTGDAHTRSDRDEVFVVDGLDTVLQRTIHRHVGESPDREVGGVLIGTLAEDAPTPHVVDALPARDADERHASLTFSHRTWEHVFAALDERYPPDHRIVGWYHSHPSFGIFLSARDLFIHRRFFTDPRQIAVVVDPVQRIEGVFSWVNGDVVKRFERSVAPSEPPNAG